MKHLKNYTTLSLWTVGLFSLSTRIGFKFPELYKYKDLTIQSINKIIGDNNLDIKSIESSFERIYNISFHQNFTILDFWNLLPIFNDVDNETVEKTSLGRGHESIKITRFGISIWDDRIFDMVDLPLISGGIIINLYFNEIDEKIYRFPVKNLHNKKLG